MFSIKSRLKLAVIANIYVASAVVAGVLANHRRRSANLLCVPCISEEGDKLLLRLTARQTHELAVEYKQWWRHRFVTITHLHGSARVCCKDDNESLWGRAKFDPLPPLNPLSDRHENLCR